MYTYTYHGKQFRVVRSFDYLASSATVDDIGRTPLPQIDDILIVEGSTREKPELLLYSGEGWKKLTAKNSFLDVIYNSSLGTSPESPSLQESSVKDTAENAMAKVKGFEEVLEKFKSEPASRLEDPNIGRIGLVVNGKNYWFDMNEHESLKQFEAAQEQEMWRLKARRVGMAGVAAEVANSDASISKFSITKEQYAEFVRQEEEKLNQAIVTATIDDYILPDELEDFDRPQTPAQRISKFLDM